MDKIELTKVLKIIREDSNAIENWRSICDEVLGLHSVEFENFAKHNPINDLFKKILDQWKSENGQNATKANLETAFRNKNWNYIAGKNIMFLKSSHGCGQINNYTGLQMKLKN